jgi:hypothetical protein
MTAAHPLRGEGFLAMWHDITPEAEPDFNA